MALCREDTQMQLHQTLGVMGQKPKNHMALSTTEGVESDQVECLVA